MKVQCDVCEKAVAAVICCADEAALCLSCDDRIHAANKLASKHQRLRLLYVNNSSSNHITSDGSKGDISSKDSSSSCGLPICDICQEKTAFIFCLEDRALLCRDCDLSIHPAKTLAAGHRRFLSAGVRVALNATDEEPKKPTESSQHKPEEPRMHAPASFKAGVPPPPTRGKRKDPNHPSATGHSSISKSSSSATSSIYHSGSINDVYGVKHFPSHAVPWQLDEVLSLPDSEVHNIEEHAPSKVDLMAFGEYDWMADLSVFDDDVFMESPAEVPKITPMHSLCPSIGKINTGIKPAKTKEDAGLVSSLSDLFAVPVMDINYDPYMQAKRRKT